MDEQIICMAATESLAVYSTPNDETNVLRVEQFRPFGELVARVHVEKQSDTAFVSFRGTKLVGNWLFTNFQAFFAPLAVVDDSLSEAAAKPLQAGRYRMPLLGSTHQGFARAFTWLWYGDDPLVGITQLEVARAARQRIARHGIIIGLGVSLWFVAISVSGSVWLQAAPLLFALFLNAIVVGTERGTWEDLRRRDPQTSGKPLHKRLKELNHRKSVVFTGHSLGGAIAAVAFAVYRRWCKSDLNRQDNALLVTFGAPRIGDETLVEAFEAEHKGRFVHVIHPGDPVPEMPPRAITKLLTQRYWCRGLVGFLLTAISQLWYLYAFVYGLRRPGEWSECFVLYTGSARSAFDKANHDMDKYKQAVACDPGRG